MLTGGQNEFSTFPHFFNNAIVENFCLFLPIYRLKKSFQQFQQVLLLLLSNNLTELPQNRLEKFTSFFLKNADFGFFQKFPEKNSEKIFRSVRKYPPETKSKNIKFRIFEISKVLKFQNTFSEIFNLSGKTGNYFLSDNRF